MTQRVNVLILLVLPFVFIGAIKATNSFLPERYYFSFSSLVGQSGSPFVVSQPTIPISEACRIVQRYRVDIQDFRYGANCAVELGRRNQQQAANEFPLSPRELDAVYSHFLRLDAQTAYTLRLGLTDAPADIFKLPANRIDGAIRYATTRQSALRQLRDALTNHVEQNLNRLLEPGHAELDKLVAKVPVTSGQQSNQGSNEPPPLSDAEKVRIRGAFEDYQRTFTPKVWAARVSGIQKSDIDRKLDELERSGYASRSSLKRSMLAVYIEPITQAVAEDFDRGMTSRGIEPFDMVNVKRQLGAQMAVSASQDYFIAGFIRILPILIVSAGVGLWLGRSEVMSIGVAAGMAALLLSWPIVLLWDTVVGSEWTEFRPLFIGFYAVYILVFFFVGRSGALIGSYVRARVSPARADEQGVADGAAAGTGDVRLASVAKEVSISLVANGVMLLLNLAIPLARVT